MFAFSTSPSGQRERPALPDALREQVRPVIVAASRTIPVDPAFEVVLPHGALQRGTTLVLLGPEGSGATSLGIALMAHASSTGHWCAVVGARDPGIAAMKELGLDMARVLFVPRPRGGWAEATAELIDGVDLLLLCPPERVPHGAARRLVARAKERRCTLLVRTTAPGGWPVPPETTLSLSSSCWQGAGRGDGYLSARRVLVTTHGRRGASRPVEHWLWVPSRRGRVQVAGDQWSDS